MKLIRKAASKVETTRRRKPKRTIDGAAENWGEQYHLKAIGRALDVIESFPDENTELSLKEIGRSTGLPESSLFRILLTLENRGYLLQNGDGAYRLAPKLLFGRLHERAEHLRTCARPLLHELAARFDETASLACLVGDQVRVLDVLESFHEVRMGNRPGRVIPPHCSSLGKSITAFQDARSMDAILDAYGLYRRTDRTIVERGALMREFEEIRASGFACDREETVLGGVCFGAPISNPAGRVFAAISVSTPIVRMTPAREIEISSGVVETARRIENRLRGEEVE